MLTGTEQALYTLFTRIAAVDQLGRALVERTLPPPVTLAQLAVLGELGRAGGARTPQALATALGVTKQTMTTTLKRLHREGLAQVRISPKDRRVKLVSRTADGARLHGNCLQRLGPELSLAADAVPKGLIEALSPRLMALQQALDQP
ncbi:MarR family winged helix-turn-helix transcriptional regulator [Sandaracinobacter neustonicus]|uniref:MarR family winged helix-turn-helix transcriptional regulator n=1 Tax=Sandaracinobacter neustonicus TaxID=1715348 RepID=UPI0015E4742B|nr:MarR family transcriptional regulator [Sandaracinobacter neustonicus]